MSAERDVLSSMRSAGDIDRLEALCEQMIPLVGALLPLLEESWSIRRLIEERVFSSGQDVDVWPPDLERHALLVDVLSGFANQDGMSRTREIDAVCEVVDICGLTGMARAWVER